MKLRQIGRHRVSFMPHFVRKQKSALNSCRLNFMSPCFHVALISWFKVLQTLRCNLKRVFPAYHAYIEWLLANKGTNCIFLSLKIAPYLENVLHKGCENALRFFLDFFSDGKITILTQNMVFIR